MKKNQKNRRKTRVIGRRERVASPFALPFDFPSIFGEVDSVRKIPAGQPIFTIGEPGATMYVLRSGTAQVQVGDLIYETMAAGGIVGEMALLDPSATVRSATVFALTDCEVVEIDRTRLLEIVQADPRFALALCEIVVKRLRATTSLTHVDPVTRLPNRYRFQDLCRAGLERCQRRGTPMAVMMIDIDHFGSVNESLGNSAGDELLRVLAARLAEAVRSIDAMARFSADVFALLLEELRSANDLVAIAQRVLEAVRRPIAAGGKEIYLTASVGISCFPQDGSDPESLVHAAEFATRGAIAEGRDRYGFHSAEMHRLADEARELRNELRLALERDEFHLVYQPRVGVTTGRITGVEALLRWRHPELKAVAPSRFIPIAEQTGMIDAIGEWVLRKASAQMREWLGEGIPQFRMAVNLSLRQFRRADLPQRVAAILQETGLEPRHLELEVTESTMMEDPAKAVYLLKALKGMGIRVALDDFGTEYSSLGYVRQFPLDYLKIDQSFVRGVPSREEDVAIAKTVITLAKTLKLPVIAEGVETTEQLSFLAAHGCEEYQGYLFSRPLAAGDAGALLHRNLGSTTGRNFAIAAPASAATS